jgi:hypothetical protein
VKEKASVRAASATALVFCAFLAVFLLSDRGGSEFVAFKRRYRIEVSAAHGWSVEADGTVLSGEEEGERSDASRVPGLPPAGMGDPWLERKQGASGFPR